MLIQPQEVEDWPDHKVVVISTGSQGEPLSALRRMAYDDHRAIKLHRGDTVVFSATPIPGNERAVNETVDRLYHIGCDVVTAREAPIHASGHGYVEELKLMLNLVRPRYVMPVHGDHKRIRLHAQLADAVGIDPDDVFQCENGLPLEIDERGARFGEPEQSGMIFVDGVDIGDPADVALRDRRMLSADGIFIVVATISEQTGESVVAARGDLPRRAVHRAGRRARRRDPRRGRALADRRGAGRGPGDRPPPAGAPRRPGGVRLRPAAPPPDGAAGRRRGLSRLPRAADLGGGAGASGSRIRHRDDLEPVPSSRVCERDRAAVGLGHRADDRQPEPGAAAAVAAAAHEPLEHARLQLRRDPRTVVVLDDDRRRRAGRSRGCAVPGGVWRTAFSIRFSTSRCRSSLIPSTIAGSVEIVSSWCSAIGPSSAAASVRTSARSVGRRGF